MTRRLTVALILFGLFAEGFAFTNDTAVRVVYNATDSAPKGLYWVTPPTDLALGDVVVARLPVDTASFADGRGYLPKTVPVLKHIAAIEGNWVCFKGGWLYVDGRPVARPLTEDGLRRPLTPWRHCRALVAGELFLLNPTNPASFDSRYFGPIDASFVRGRATPW